MNTVVKRLGDVIELKYGKSISSSDRDPNGENFIYGANGVLGKTNKFLFDSEALIVGRKGSAGEVNKVSGKIWPSDVTYYILGNESVNIDYIYYLLRFLNLPKLARGVKPGINRNDIYALSVPIPDTTHQRNTAKVFAQMDTLRQKRKQAIILFDDYLKSVFNEMFGDPVKNPQGWKKQRLDQLCSEIADIDHKMPKAVKNGFPFISAKDLLDDGTISFSDIKYISEEDYLKLSRKIKPRKGDIIYSRIGAKLGKARLVTVDFDFLVSYSCCTIRPETQKINTLFLTHLLNTPSLLRQALSDVRAIGVPDLGMDKIRAFEIVTPPMHLQTEFAAIAKEVDDLRQRSLMQSKVMDDLFNSQMQRSFNQI